jgi:hypothetical protein
MFTADYLSEIFKQEAVQPVVNLLINPQRLPLIIESIEQWA